MTVARTWRSRLTSPGFDASSTRSIATPVTSRMVVHRAPKGETADPSTEDAQASQPGHCFVEVGDGKSEGVQSDNGRVRPGGANKDRVNPILDFDGRTRARPANVVEECRATGR